MPSRTDLFITIRRMINSNIRDRTLYLFLHEMRTIVEKLGVPAGKDRNSLFKNVPGWTKQRGTHAHPTRKNLNILVERLQEAAAEKYIARVKKIKEQTSNELNNQPTRLVPPSTQEFHGQELEPSNVVDIMNLLPTAVLDTASAIHISKCHGPEEDEWHVNITFTRK